MTAFTDNAFKFDPLAPVLLLKIIRADTSIIRLCNDAVDITNLDGTYTKIGMGIKAPSDDGDSVSKGSVRIANVPSIITDINGDNGLERATFILMDIVRSDPNNPLMILTMLASRISMSLEVINVELEHRDFYNRSLVNKVYNFSTSPGLY